MQAVIDLLDTRDSDCTSCTPFLRGRPYPDVLIELLARLLKDLRVAAAPRGVYGPVEAEAPAPSCPTAVGPDGSAAQGAAGCGAHGEGAAVRVASDHQAAGGKGQVKVTIAHEAGTGSGSVDAGMANESDKGKQTEAASEAHFSGPVEAAYPGSVAPRRGRSLISSDCMERRSAVS